MTKRLLTLVCGLWLASASLAFATDWYVDNAATGANNGTSWTNAWTSFSSIVWGASGVKAGDTLYISGGTSSKTYTTPLVVGASGASGSPITVRPGSASPSPTGHSGVVTITATGGAGITITNRSYVTVDGNDNGAQKIRVTGSWTTATCTTGNCGGIEVYWSAHHVILQYLEVDSNGNNANVNGIMGNFSTLDTYPVLEISHCRVHDNWQDQINVGYSGSYSPGPTPGVYGRWSIHDSEIYNGYDDFVQEGAPGLDFYNNSMHTHLTAYHNGVSVGHPDGLEIATHTTRIWNNVFYNMGYEAPYYDANMGAYIYLSVYLDMPAGASVGGYQIVHDNLLYSTLATASTEYSTKGIELTPQSACCTSPTDALTHVYIYNNTIVGMPNNGLNMMIKKGTQVTGPVGTLYVLNNLFYNNGRRLPSNTAAFSDSDRLQGTSGATESTHTTGSWGDGKDLTVDWNMFNAGPAGSALIDYKSAYPLLTYAQFVAIETGGTGSGIHPQDGITTAIATADPLLTATYSLGTGSPAIGHGGDLTSLAGAPAYDRNGVLRPSGAGWDIGSVQYTTAGTVPTCSYALGSSSQSVAAAGGSGTVSVTTSTGCSWTTASNATWVTVTPATGSGPGTVGFTVAANTTAAVRTATLTIGGQPFTVTQAAAAATCTYALGSSGQSVAAAGGSGTVSVTTSAGCGWSTTSSATWVTATPAAASGPGTVSFTVAANTTVAARTATLTIGGQTFTVTQAAATGSATAGWAAASGGSQFGLAINSDGTLWAWGLNDYGQLGDGSKTDRLVPVRIGADFTWSAVSPGWSHSLALKLDGTLWGWGLNNFGQVGDGTASSRSVPTQIGSDNKWVVISAGYTHSLGLKSDGTLWAWGSNSHGQLGDGTTTDRLAPVQVGSEKTWVQISAGGYHSLALKSDGTLWAWGFNGDQYNWGQLGDGTNIERHSPVQVGSENTWRAVSAGFAISAGIKADGTLWTWGGGHMGEQAQGDWASRVVPTQVGSGTSWVAVAAKNDTLHVIKSDGTLWGAGDNTYGQLGDGTYTGETTLVQIGSDNKWRVVPRADFYGLGMKSDGTVWAWGRNEHGAMGDGTTTNRNSPVQIPAPPPKAPSPPTSVIVKIP